MTNHKLKVFYRHMISSLMWRIPSEHGWWWLAIASFSLSVIISVNCTLPIFKKYNTVDFHCLLHSFFFFKYIVVLLVWLLTKKREISLLSYFIHSLGKKRWIHTFSKAISVRLTNCQLEFELGFSILFFTLLTVVHSHPHHHMITWIKIKYL